MYILCEYSLPAAGALAALPWLALETAAGFSGTEIHPLFFSNCYPPRSAATRAPHEKTWSIIV